MLADHPIKRWEASASMLVGDAGCAAVCPLTMLGHGLDRIVFALAVAVITSICLHINISEDHDTLSNHSQTPFSLNAGFCVKQHGSTAVKIWGVPAVSSSSSMNACRWRW